MLKILVAIGSLLAFAVPAGAQTFRPGVAVTDTNPSPVKQMCWDGVSAYVACSSAAAQPTVTRGPAQSTITAASPNTITAGGTSQQAFAANTARIYLFCQNPIAASETLFVEIGAAASASGSSYELAPGGSLTFNGGGMVPTGAVNVLAATTAHRFICKQG